MKAEEKMNGWEKIHPKDVKNLVIKMPKKQDIQEVIIKKGHKMEIAVRFLFINKDQPTIK